MPDITQPTYTDGVILTAESLNDLVFDKTGTSYEKVNGKLGTANLDAAFLVESEMVKKGSLVRIARVSGSSFLEFEAPTNPTPIPGAALQFDVPPGNWNVLVSWSVVADVLASDWPNTEFFVSRDTRGLTALAGTRYRGEALYQGSWQFTVTNGASPSLETIAVWCFSGDNIQIGARRMCALLIQTF